MDVYLTHIKTGFMAGTIALCDENGKALPGQVSIKYEHDDALDFPSVTVTFVICDESFVKPIKP